MVSCFRGLNERWLLGPKLIYTTMSMVYYGFYLYRSDFSDQRFHFTTTQFGYMSAIMAAVGFATMAMWGALADRTGKPVQILCLVSLGTAGSFSLLLLKTSGFVVNMGIIGLYAAFSSGFQAMCDDQVMRILSNSDKKLYGRQRVWETISFSFTTRILARLLKLYGVMAIHAWVPAAAALFILVISVYGTNEIDVDHQELLAASTPKPGEEEEGDGKKNVVVTVEVPEAPADELKSPLRVLMSNPNYLFLLFSVFLTGCARSVMSTFLTRYLRREMQLDEDQAADAAITGIVLEVIIFFSSASFLKHMGVYWMLIVAQFCMVVRGWAYVMMPAKASNWWMVYLVELFKGVAFGFTQSAGVRLANEIVPPGLEATSQSLYTGMYSQLPAVLVACVGGIVWDTWGSRVLFMSTAILSTCALVLFLFKYSCDGHIGFGKKRAMTI